MPKSKFLKRKFKITKAGYSFMLITIGIGLAGLNTGNNLLYLLFGMMLSFIIISGVLSDSSMRRTSVVRLLPSEIFAGAMFPVKLTVENKKSLIPSYSITVEDLGEHSSAKAKFIVKVPPKDSVDVFYLAKFLERGLKKFRGFKILTKFPFGLILKADHLKSEEDVLVYPEVIDIRGLFLGSRFFHGEFLSGVKGQGINPWGLRDYRYGDDARLIHWKSTAKSGKWMIKEFESEKKMRVVVDLLLLNPSSFSSKAYRKKSEYLKIEKMISLSASTIIFLMNQGYEVLLSINGSFCEVEGRGYLSGYLKRLALLDIEKLPHNLEGHYDDPGLHIVLTNLSSAEVAGKVGSTAYTIDRKSIEEVYTNKNLKGEKDLEL